MMCLRLLILALLLLPILAEQALACPEREGLIDYNCDGRVKIGIIGDSFVAGVGDQPKDLILGNGYVQRLRKKYLTAVIAPFAKPGIVSGKLLAKIKQRMPTMLSLPDDQNLLDADYIIIDAGRNDYWEKTDPGETVRNLFRIVKFVKEVTLRKTGATPHIFVSALTPTRRSYQRPFINTINYKLNKYKSSSMPLYIRYDRYMKSSLLASDGLHPKAEGYTKMAEIIESFLENKGRSLILKDRKDSDLDGVYDNFERSKFHTSRTLADTDFDTFSDGYEIFVSLTNPLDALSHP